MELQQLVDGAVFVTELGVYGSGGRALYQEATRHPEDRLRWGGDTP